MDHLFYVIALENEKYHSPKSRCMSFNFSLGKSLGNSKMKKSLHSSDSLQADWELMQWSCFWRLFTVEDPGAPGRALVRVPFGPNWCLLEPLPVKAIAKDLCLHTQHWERRLSTARLTGALQGRPGPPAPGQRPLGPVVGPTLVFQEQPLKVAWSVI